MTGRILELQKILQPFGVEALYVFGSRSPEVASWIRDKARVLNAGPADVDVGVRSVRGVRWDVDDKVGLALALEAFLGVNRVDLVDLSEADPFLAAEIVRGERLFAADDHAADEYELYVLRRAGDLAPLERERMALLMGRYR